MNIVVISHSSVVGLYQQKLAMMHRQYHDKLSLITPPSWTEGGREVIAEIHCYPELNVTPLPVHWPNKLNRHYYLWKELWKHLRQQRPDLIYIEEEPRSLCAFQAHLFCRSNNIPYVFYTWENIARKYNLIHAMLFRIVRRSAAAAVVGSWDAAEILRRRSFKAPMLIQPQYGVDPALFYRRTTSRFKEGWRVSGPVVGYAGRLIPEKGVSLLLQAFEKLTIPATCVIAGGGPELNSLKEFAARLRRAQDIYFIGPVPHEQMPELLSALDIIVLPSRTTATWKEQFGRILIEAMACEVCAVGSDSGAIPAVIGTAGWIFKENDAHALQKILYDLIVNEEERKRLAEEGRARVLEHFTNAIFAKQLHEFFMQVKFPKA
ncbi:MAG: glycosyltransferase [Bacteroidota bacterium]